MIFKALGTSVACLLAVTMTARSSAQSTPWEKMDYGPFLSTTVELEPGNIAYKGIAVPVGATSNGTATMLFDMDLLRWAGGWQGGGVDLRGIVYDGPHGVHPGIDGELDWSTDSRPGASTSGEFVDIRPWGYGPIDVRDGRWHGLRVDGDQVAFSYRVGATEVLETPGGVELDGLFAYTRTLSIQGSDANLILKILKAPRRSMTSLASHVSAEGFASHGSDHRFGVVLSKSGAPYMAIGLVQASNEDARLKQMGSEIVLSVNPSGHADPEMLLLMISPVDDEDDLDTFDRLLRAAKLPANHDRFLHPQRPAQGAVVERIVSSIQTCPPSPEGSGSIEIDRKRGEVSVDLPVTRINGGTLDLIDFSGKMLGLDEAPADSSFIVETPVSSPVPVRPLASWSFDRGEGDRILNRATGRKDLLLDGPTWRRGLKGRCLDFDGTDVATWSGSRQLSLRRSDYTFAAWISTRGDGTIMSIMDPGDRWSPGEMAFFIRDGNLAFDIGWEGVIEGSTSVIDGSWHHVAFTWSHDNRRVSLYVDGVPDASGTIPPGDTPEETVLHLGMAADDFPVPSPFSGFMEGVELFDVLLDPTQIISQAGSSGSPLVNAWVLSGHIDGARWMKQPSGNGLLRLPDCKNDQMAFLHEWRGPREHLLPAVADIEKSSPVRRAFRVEELVRPIDTPTNSWMRFGAIDFLPGGDDIVVTTWSGEVWLVGPDQENESGVQWTRIASGLNQPLGIAVRNGEILVLGRDQVTRLVDLNGDLITDFYENINNDSMNSEHFHEPATGLQVDQSGHLYYLKAARHAKDACHPHHGTLIRISDEGTESTVLASGFRAPNGLFVDEEGVFFCSDQEGHWMPANRINRIEPGGFYGNKWTGHEDRDRSDYDRPLLWIHPSVDRSPSSQLRVDDPAWGQLHGRLLGLSYGTGSVYLILEDEVDGVHQGGVVPLPIKVPTGLMSGRFSPSDSSLHLCGLVGWSSDASEDGGLYRVSPTGPLPPMPLEVRAVSDGLVLTFSQPLEPEAQAVDRWDVEAWNYLWSERYGSPEITLAGDREGRTSMQIKSVVLSPDRRKAWLQIPDMTTAMQVHVDYMLPFSGREREGFAHLTVHELHEASGRSKLGD